MFVSINPLYRCNFRCTNCYLTEDQLSDRQVLSLTALREKLAQLDNIEAIELYGGEITLLSDEYVADLKAVVREFYTGPISVVTNFFLTPDWLREDDIEINVSFDFEHRPHYDKVLTNLLSFGDKTFDLIILATPEVMDGNVTEQIALINMFHNVRSVDIKPYSANQANHHEGTNEAFVEYIKQWVTQFDHHKLKNAHLIKESLSGKRNAFSDDHVYITPSGNLGVLEFDQDDREYFLELASIEAYWEWCEKEKHDNLSEHCKQCEFKGRCLTEHYRRKEGEYGECSGFKSLLQWWVESNPSPVPSSR